MYGEAVPTGVWSTPSLLRGHDQMLRGRGAGADLGACIRRLYGMRYTVHAVGDFSRYACCCSVVAVGVDASCPFAQGVLSVLLLCVDSPQLHA